MACRIKLRGNSCDVDDTEVVTMAFLAAASCGEEKPATQDGPGF